MRIYIALQALIGCLAIALLAGCSFHVGFDYNGKTGVDNQTVSPEFKTTKGTKY